MGLGGAWRRECQVLGVLTASLGPVSVVRDPVSLHREPAEPWTQRCFERPQLSDGQWEYPSDAPRGLRVVPEAPHSNCQGRGGASMSCGPGGPGTSVLWFPLMDALSLQG